MKQPRKTIVYEKALELINHVLIHGVSYSGYNEKLSYQGYERTETGDNNKVFQDTFMTVQGLHRHVSTGAWKLIGTIGDELKMNNGLWHHKPDSRKQYIILKELIDNCILIKTEDPYIFFVNPMYIRRGSLSGVLALTLKVLGDASKPTTDHIHDLRYTKRITLDALEITNGNLPDANMYKLLPGNGVAQSSSQPAPHS